MEKGRKFNNRGETLGKHKKLVKTKSETRKFCFAFKTFVGGSALKILGTLPTVWQEIEVFFLSERSILKDREPSLEQTLGNLFSSNSFLSMAAAPHKSINRAFEHFLRISCTLYRICVCSRSEHQNAYLGRRKKRRRRTKNFNFYQPTSPTREKINISRITFPNATEKNLRSDFFSSNRLCGGNLLKISSKPGFWSTPEATRRLQQKFFIIFQAEMLANKKFLIQTKMQEDWLEFLGALRKSFSGNFVQKVYQLCKLPVFGIQLNGESSSQLKV